MSTATTWIDYLSVVVSEPGVSDLFFTDGGSSSFFIKGHLKDLPGAFCDGRTFDGLIRAIFQDLGSPRLPHGTALEPSIQFGEHRFRVSYCDTFQGRECVLRYLPSIIPRPGDLLLPESLVAEFIGLEAGLVLVGGSMGSGKTTSVASLLIALARTKALRIETIEDPVEYALPSSLANGSQFRQREIGTSCTSFVQGLKEARRRRAQVIVVGEVRDAETAEQCLRAALMGHLVVATIHAEDAPTLIKSFLAELRQGTEPWGRHALAASLRIMLVQRLLISSETDGLIGIHEVAFNRRSHSAIGAWIRSDTGIPGGLYNAMNNFRNDGMQTFGESLDQRIKARLLPADLRNEPRFSHQTLR